MNVKNELKEKLREQKKQLEHLRKMFGEIMSEYRLGCTHLEDLMLQEMAEVEELTDGRKLTLDTLDVPLKFPEPEAPRGSEETDPPKAPLQLTEASTVFETPKQKTFGELVVELRTARKWSQAEFASIVHMTVSELKNIEQGRRRAYRPKVKHFAKCLDAPENMLLLAAGYEVQTNGHSH